MSIEPAGPIIAHRGATALQPENTLAAIREAAKLGVKWVEFDAQVTADGGVVVMHDHTVDRTTEGTGPVAMKATRDMLCLRTRDPSGQSISEHKVPLVEDALDLSFQLGLGVVLEIKATWGIDAQDARTICAVVPNPAPANLLVTSFSVPALLAVAEARPDLPLGLAVLRAPVDPVATAKSLSLTAVHCNAPYTTAADISALRAASLHVSVATVNDAAEARRFLDAGAHGVMTDIPTLLS